MDNKVTTVDDFMTSWIDENIYEYDLNFDLINISRLTKYWASKEIAAEICRNVEVMINEDDFIFGDGYVSGHRKYLTQILKKEWFR